MSELFVLSNIVKKYVKGSEVVSIFDNVNLDIAAADFVAIMGPSGSGKTTLLNLLGGIDQVTSGSLGFGGEQLERYDEARLSKWRARNVGFIFQSYNLIPMLNAAQNVELPLLLTNLKAKARAAHVKTALELVGLSDRARHYPKEMSGGQQQRVAIARALVADPVLLLCDEPTGDLDRKTADEILGILRILNRDFGKTIVMVTHDPAAAAYAKRTLHLDKGVFTEDIAYA
ncbi:MAG: ABC transporter ATP-binding protein [Pseudomonadota bacterium]